ncbi:Suppressor of Sensor Kinase (SLN1), partial [Nowakowskiella sp. JEL0078]
MPSPVTMEANGSPSVTPSLSLNDFDYQNFVRPFSAVDDRIRSLHIRESISSLNDLMEMCFNPRSSSKLPDIYLNSDPCDNENNVTTSYVSCEILPKEEILQNKISTLSSLIRNPRFEKKISEIDNLPLNRLSQNGRLLQSESFIRPTSQILHDSQVAKRRKQNRKYLKNSRRTSLPTQLATNHRLLNNMLAQKSPDSLTQQQLAKQDDLENYLDDIAAQIHRQTTNQMSTKEKKLLHSLASKEDRFTILESRLAKSIIDERFPKWISGQAIGFGANGVVEVAIHPDTQEPLFAIKKTNGYQMTDGLHERQVYKAAIKMLMLFDHPNILKYYCGEIVDNTFTTYLEFCNEGSLTNKIYDDFANGEAESPGIMDEFVIKQFTHDIVKGLDFFHRHDVVHRDIKPGNIMIHDGIAKLGDMGAMRIQNRCCNESHGVNIMGSPSYLAPETVTGHHNLGAVGAQDIWALGCCIFEMILGQAPWIAIDNVWSLYFMIGTWMTRALAAREICSTENPEEKERKFPSNVQKYRGKNILHQQKILLQGRKDKDIKRFSNSSSICSVGNYDSVEHILLHPKNISRTRQNKFYLQKKRQQENQIQQIQQYQQEYSFQSAENLKIESQFSSASSTPSAHAAENEYPFSDADGLSRPKGLMFAFASLDISQPNHENTGTLIISAADNSKSLKNSRSNSSRGRWWKPEEDENIEEYLKTEDKYGRIKRSGSGSKSLHSEKSDCDHESEQNSFTSILIRRKSKNSLRCKSPSHSIRSKNSASNLEEEGQNKISSLFGRQRSLSIGHGQSNNSKNQDSIPPVPPIPEKFASLGQVSPSLIKTQSNTSFLTSTYSISRPYKGDDARSITLANGSNYSYSNTTLYSENDFSKGDEKKQRKKTRSLRSLSKTSLYRRKEEKESGIIISSGVAVPLSSSPRNLGRKPTQIIPVGNTLIARRDVTMTPLKINKPKDFERFPQIMSSPPKFRGHKLSRPPKVFSSVGKLSSHPIFSHIMQRLAQLTSTSSLSPGTNTNDIFFFSQAIAEEDKAPNSEAFIKHTRKRSLNRLRSMMKSSQYSELPQPLTNKSISSLPLQTSQMGLSVPILTQEDILKNSRRKLLIRMPMTSLLSQAPSHDEARVVKWMSDAMKLSETQNSIISKTEDESEYGDHFNLDDYFTETTMGKESRLSNLSLGISVHSDQFDEVGVVESYQQVDELESVTVSVKSKSSLVTIEGRSENCLVSSESVGDIDGEKRFSWEPEPFQVKGDISFEIRGVETKFSPNILITDEIPPLNHESNLFEEGSEKVTHVVNRLQLMKSRKDGVNSKNSKNLWAIGNPYYEKNSLNHPLVDMAKESGKFSEEALDF